MMSAVAFDPREQGEVDELRDHQRQRRAAHAARLQGAARRRSARRRDADEEFAKTEDRVSERQPAGARGHRQARTRSEGQDDAGAAEDEGRVGQVARRDHDRTAEGRDARRRSAFADVHRSGRSVADAAGSAAVRSPTSSRASWSRRTSRSTRRCRPPDGQTAQKTLVVTIQTVSAQAAGLRRARSARGRARGSSRRIQGA